MTLCFRNMTLAASFYYLALIHTHLINQDSASLGLAKRGAAP